MALGSRLMLWGSPCAWGAGRKTAFRVPGEPGFSSYSHRNEDTSLGRCVQGRWFIFKGYQPKPRHTRHREGNAMSDLATIRRFLSLVNQPGELIELRCDQSEGERKTRKHGYYNDHHKAAQDAADFAGNVYFTVNRLAPNLPATNELIPCRKGCCTKAKDIVRRTLLYLDGDPVRPSGTASTDEQHQAAIDLVRFVAGQLSFPKPIIGSSGNGACAFWKIDLPPDSTLPKRVLKTIKAKWETPAVSIDLTVASAARIGRLLGTDNHKGGKARRQSTILDAPTIITPAERIEQYGEWVENPERSKTEHWNF